MTQVDPSTATTDPAMSMDAKLQTIDSITHHWTLPGLPDAVKLDLGMQQNSPDEISQFLNDVHSKMTDALDPRKPSQPILDAPPVQSLEYDTLPDLPNTHTPTPVIPKDPLQSVKGLYHGLAGDVEPDVADPDAIVDFKTKAKQMGLISNDYPNDSTWSPEMNHVYAQYLHTNQEKALAGNKPGSMPFTKLTTAMDEWMSPSFLVKAATKMGYWWNFGQIAKETDRWGSKWDKLGASLSGGNVLSIAHNFLDAATGPLDDIVMPALNMASLASGIGEAVTFARTAESAEGVAHAISWGGLGKQALEARAVDSDIGIGAKLRALVVPGAYSPDMAVADRAGMKNGSLISNILGHTGAEGGVIQSHLPGVASAAGTIGDGMQGWRNLEVVQDSKKVTQIGMRLGQQALLEQALFPNASYTKGVTDLRDQRAKHPNAMGIADYLALPIAPQHIMPEGSYSGVFNGMLDAAKSKLKDVPGSTQWVQEFTDGMMALGGQDANSQRFASLIKKQGPVKGLQSYFGDEEAGQILTQAATAASVHAQAVAHATAAAPARYTGDAAKWRDSYDDFVGAAAGHIAGFSDPSDLDGYLHYLKLTGRGDQVSRVTQLSKSDPAALATELQNAVGQSQSLRAGYLGKAFDQLAEPGGQGAIRNYVINNFRHVDDFKSFRNASDMLERGLASGKVALDNPVRNVFASTVGQDSSDPVVHAISDIMTPGMGEPAPSDFHQTFDALTKGNNTFNKVQVGLGRVDGFYQPEAKAFLERQNEILQRSRAVSDMLRDREGTATTLESLRSGLGQDQTLHDLTQEEAVQRATAAHEADVTNWEPIDKGVYENRVKVLRWMDSKGIALDDVQASVDDEVKKAMADSTWFQHFDAQAASDTDLGKLVSDGNMVASRMAAPIASGDPEFLAALREQGYIPIGGKGGYWLPQHINSAVPQLSQIGKHDLQRLSMAQFMFGAGTDDAGANTAMETLRKARFRTSLSDRLEALQAKGMPIPDEMLDTNHPFYSDALSAVRSSVFQGKEDVQGQIDNSKNMLSTLTARIHAGTVPMNERELGKSEVARILAERGYDSDTLARPVWLALQDSINTGAFGFKYDGIAGIEKWLRGNSVPIQALKLMGKTNVPTEAKRAFMGIETPGMRKALTFAGIGALAGQQAGGDPQSVLEGAGLGAVASAAPSLLPGNDTSTARLASAAVGGAAGLIAGNQVGKGPEGGIIGAVGGYVGGGTVARKAVRLMENTGWDEYTRLPDKLSTMMARTRFALSPMFDARRYTKNVFLTQAENLPNAADGTKAFLPLINGKKPYISRYGEEAFESAKREWNTVAAAKGVMSPDASALVDEADRAFAQEGILGFSPLYQNAARYGELRRQGVSMEDAYNAVDHMSSMGGKSGLERSMNFMFFPFSFEKKVTKSLGSFLSQDVSRAIMLHDALKTYDVLNERYDLTNKLKDHVPLAEDLQQLNAFSHGFGLGELGGINAPLLNLFVPVMLNLGKAAAGQPNDLGAAVDPSALVRRLMPAYKDIDKLVSDVKEEGHVVFGPDHLTTDAESTAAWDALRTERASLDVEAKRRGLGAFSPTAGKGQEDLVQAYKLKKNQIMTQYPTMKTDIDQMASARQSSQTEMSQLAADPDIAGQLQLLGNATGSQKANYLSGMSAQDPKQAAKVALGVVAQADTELQNTLRTQGFDLANNPEDVPPTAFDQMHALGISLSQAVPGFADEWNKHYRSIWGPLTKKVW